MTKAQSRQIEAVKAELAEVRATRNDAAGQLMAKNLEKTVDELTARYAGKAAKIRSLIEDEGMTRAEAKAWVQAFEAA